MQLIIISNLKHLLCFKVSCLLFPFPPPNGGNLKLVGPLRTNENLSLEQFWVRMETSSLHSLHISEESCQNVENTAWPWKLVSSNWKVEFDGGLRTACLSWSSAGTPGPTQETIWGVLHLRCVLISTCCWWPSSWGGLHTQPSSNPSNYIRTAYLVPIKHRNVTWNSRLTTLPD